MRLKFSVLISMLLIAGAAQAQTKSISVRGEGEVRVQPDKAEVQVQVRTKAKDAQSAQALNAKEMARVHKVLKSEFKIDGKDIQTSSFNVNPDYRYEQNGKQVFLGFNVEHGLVLQVKDLTQLGRIFDSVVGKGTEQVSVLLQNVNFTSTKRLDFEIQAMEHAMKNADAKASALAKFAKKSLKGVLRISDSSVDFQPPPGPVFAERAMKVSASAGASDVSPGEIVIRSNVAVEYQID